MFWDMMPIIVVRIHQNFKGTCCLHHHGNDKSAHYPECTASHTGK